MFSLLAGVAGVAAVGAGTYLVTQSEDLSSQSQAFRSRQMGSLQQFETTQRIPGNNDGGGDSTGPMLTSQPSPEPRLRFQAEAGTIAISADTASYTWLGSSSSMPFVQRQSYNAKLSQAEEQDGLMTQQLRMTSTSNSWRNIVWNFSITPLPENRQDRTVATWSVDSIELQQDTPNGLRSFYINQPSELQDIPIFQTEQRLGAVAYRFVDASGTTAGTAIFNNLRLEADFRLIWNTLSSPLPVRTAPELQPAPPRDVIPGPSQPPTVVQ